MPRATVSTQPQLEQLKSLPEGWVKLRRMSHGEMLHRQDLAMSMQMQADQRTRKASMDIKQMQTLVSQFEFSVCVVDHNLEDDNSRKLDFRSPVDVSNLDGRVGAEIASLIEEMHDWENELPNSSTKSTTSSSAQDEVKLADKGPIPSKVVSLSS